MAECFVIETNGGPFPGSRVVPADVFPWPLPEILENPKIDNLGGVYMKFSEGIATPYADKEHVLKAAKYQWVPE